MAPHEGASAAVGGAAQSGSSLHPSSRPRRCRQDRSCFISGCCPRLAHMMLSDANVESVSNWFSPQQMWDALPSSWPNVRFHGGSSESLCTFRYAPGETLLLFGSYENVCVYVCVRSVGCYMETGDDATDRCYSRGMFVRFILILNGRKSAESSKGFSEWLIKSLDARQGSAVLLSPVAVATTSMVQLVAITHSNGAFLKAEKLLKW